VEDKTVSAWLVRKFITWMFETGRHRTVSDFATWLEIPRPQLSCYLSGDRLPSRAMWTRSLLD
jgi:hypothetical protein